MDDRVKTSLEKSLKHEAGKLSDDEPRGYAAKTHALLRAIDAKLDYLIARQDAHLDDAEENAAREDEIRRNGRIEWLTAHGERRAREG